MMGLADQESGGLVTVTDDDTIEKSNLSRQFLFRDWDIGRWGDSYMRLLCVNLVAVAWGRVSLGALAAKNANFAHAAA
jgi:molybdopterin/thiamine biosynthesis adenylyltransferase